MPLDHSRFFCRFLFQVCWVAEFVSLVDVEDDLGLQVNVARVVDCQVEQCASHCFLRDVFKVLEDEREHVVI